MTSWTASPLKMLWVSMGELISSWGTGWDNEGREERQLEKKMRWSFLGTCEASAVVSGMGNIDLEMWSGIGEPRFGAASGWAPLCAHRELCMLSPVRKKRQGKGKISQWKSAEKQTWNGTRMYFSTFPKMSFKLPMRTEMTLPWPPFLFQLFWVSVALFEYLPPSHEWAALGPDEFPCLTCKSWFTTNRVVSSIWVCWHCISLKTYIYIILFFKNKCRSFNMKRKLNFMVKWESSDGMCRAQYSNKNSNMKCSKHWGFLIILFVYCFSFQIPFKTSLRSPYFPVTW